MTTWAVYNNELVRRGEFFMRLSFVDNWDEEVESMNRDKRGRPYLYPDSLFDFLMPLKMYIDYRGLKGFLKGLSRKVKNLKVADYTTIWRRMTKLNPDLPPVTTVDDFIAAYDSTGIKVSSRGEWIRHKWKVRRGWIKVGVIYKIDPETKDKKIVSIELSPEDVSDNKLLHESFRKLEPSVLDSMSVFLADGAMYSGNTFEFLESHGIRAGIRIRRNASTKARGSPARARAVREYKKLGYERWKELTQYGLRWDVEALFSAVKRKFGETIRSVKTSNMFIEAKMKFIVYERMKMYGKFGRI